MMLLQILQWFMLKGQPSYVASSKSTVVYAAASSDASSNS
jgi:hypothetical protein